VSTIPGPKFGFLMIRTGGAKISLSDGESGQALVSRAKGWACKGLLRHLEFAAADAQTPRSLRVKRVDILRQALPHVDQSWESCSGFGKWI
jgi:hypothetical protein